MVTPQRELRLDINESPYALPAHVPEAHGTQPVELLLNPDFSLPAQALAQAMEEARPKVVLFDWTNNPTGAPWDAHLLEGTAAANPGCVVVVDEACASIQRWCARASCVQCWTATLEASLASLRKRGLRSSSSPGRRRERASGRGCCNTFAIIPVTPSE